MLYAFNAQIISQAGVVSSKNQLICIHSFSDIQNQSNFKSQGAAKGSKQ